MSDAAPVLFIVGCHRSGTTLLRNMMRGNPAIHGPAFEAQYLRQFMHRYPSSMPSVDAALDFLYSCDTFPQEDCPREILEQHLEGEVTSSAAFMRKIFDAMMHGRSATHLLLKETSSGVAIDQLESVFPRLVVVDLIRDPRAVIHSAQKTWPGRTLSVDIRWWNRISRAVREWGLANPGRYAVVRYESLVIEPNEAMKALCHDCRIEYDDRMLEFIQPSHYRGEQEGVDASRVDRWRSGLSAAQIKYIERGCRSEMTARGYAPLNQKVGLLRVFSFGLADQARFLFQRVRGRIRRVAQRLRTPKGEASS